MRKTMRLFAVCLMLAGCNNSKTIDGKTYDVYGFFNENTKRNPEIEYEVSVGSVIVAIIFAETIFVPIIVLGWDLYQPVARRNSDPKEIGVIK